VEVDTERVILVSVHHQQPIDFFISYNRNDKQWAEWIAWHLEQAGFTTIIQAWDFAPGSNFVLEMQEASSRANKTIAVLTPNYLAAEFTQPEWAAAFAQDPTGARRKLIPVRVLACDPNGIFGPIVYLDLVGLDPETAKQTLLSGIQEGRRKPDAPPAFPGSSSLNGSTPSPIKPINVSETWRITRVEEIASGKASTKLLAESSVVLHLVPLVGMMTELSNDVLKTTTVGLKPMLAIGWDHRFNKHGCLTWAQSHGSDLPYAYSQLFRTGEIEAVDTALLAIGEDMPTIPSQDFEREIMSSTKRYLSVLRNLEISLPVAVSISLTNVAGYSLGFGFRRYGKLDEVILLLPTIIIHNWEDDIPSAFRPAFDRLWNVFEREGSPSYGQDGVWRPSIF
jgi:hypothetical protein